MKKFLLPTLVALASTPLVTSAAVSLQNFITGTLTFFNVAIIPFLFGIAFLLFVINVLRYFIIGGANPESQEKAKMFALYSVYAFVFILIFYGIVNMLAVSIGLQGGSQPCPDYITATGGSC